MEVATPEDEREREILHERLLHWRSLYQEPEPVRGTPAWEAWSYGFFTWLRSTDLKAFVSLHVPGATEEECQEVAESLRAGQTGTLSLASGREITIFCRTPSNPGLPQARHPGTTRRSSRQFLDRRADAAWSGFTNALPSVVDGFHGSA
jgi:hypothetical protein